MVMASMNFAALFELSRKIFERVVQCCSSSSRNLNAGLSYKGTLHIQKSSFLDMVNVAEAVVDRSFDVFGKGITLQLISSTVAGKTSQSARLRGWYLTAGGLLATGEAKFVVTFHVEDDFGVPGAFTVKNEHPNEFYLVSLTLELPNDGVVEFPCNSWVFNTSKYRRDRVFFSNKLCLPSDTPGGLLDARKADLEGLRGDGSGFREKWDRIYDYDTYNDLGSGRPVLGGSQAMPYPRRCKTGRSVRQGYEVERSLHLYYVPSDERLGTKKSSFFFADAAKGLSHGFAQTLAKAFHPNDTFTSFAEIKRLYEQGLDLKNIKIPPQLVFLRELVSNGSFLTFPVPQVLQSNDRGWMTDEEFAREMLSGLNPLVIECLKVFPPRFNSAITPEHVLPWLEESTIEEALQGKRLFVLNHYDVYINYIDRINMAPDTFGYATTTVLYLQSDGTLKPLAIELSTSDSSKVITPPGIGKDWRWELAKAHAVTNDSGVHNLVSHWLRTHACIEPFVIATNRQLSILHPLNPFLKPHFKNTLAMNAQARQLLIREKGIIETTFLAGKYMVDIMCDAYKRWRFDEQGLPADLVKRGMATPDAGSKHGLKLSIEDYPYAVDGLEIWRALEEWITDYVNIVYDDDNKVVSDQELQAWWSEIIEVGHGDKKDTWGGMNNKLELVSALTTLIWVASAHHAAVNFGQYAYAGFMPNRPIATHKPVPDEGSPEFAQLMEQPERWYLSAMSRRFATIVGLITIEVLSKHAEDEEYLGERSNKKWTSSSAALAAFDKFSRKLKQVEAEMELKNADLTLKNRIGPVNIPYTLLMPFSTSGMTGRGIPSSVSI